MLLRFSRSLARIVNISDHTKCISLSLNNQQCMTLPTLINLHPNECNQALRDYPLTVNLDRCMGSCNNRVCVPDKTEDLNLSVFNMIKE